MYRLYCSPPSLICFEGDGDEVAYSDAQQAHFNHAMAEEKRKHKIQLEKTERKLSELAESKSLTEQERATLEESLEETRSQLRSREENAAIEKQKLDARYKREVAELKKRAEDADSKYRESTIRGALIDAAATYGAYSNDVLITVLREDTTVNEDGKVVVSLKTKDGEGKDTVLQMSPNEAVKWMKDRPELYGGLFKDFVARGGTPQPGANGRVDVRNLTVEQVKKLYKENPERLGL